MGRPLRGRLESFSRHTGDVLISLGANWAIEVHTTDRSHGDFSVSSSDVDLRRSVVVNAPWTWLQLMHGTTIVPVERPGGAAGSEADGAWTTELDAPLAVTSADCAPVVLAAASTSGAALAVVHAGWKGLEAGIIEAAARQVVAAVGTPAHRISHCGPCIGPEDYEFSPSDLDRIARRLGPTVKGLTTAGQPALDLFSGVAEALGRSGFPVPQRPCSTAHPRFFSHRVRADRERMTTVARMVLADSGQDST